eukprot:m.53832 g.53832  ORF g.53832 m.53832 type:complete len:466 (+) comp10883_c0_seq10:117-1514(+)
MFTTLRHVGAKHLHFPLLRRALSTTTVACKQPRSNKNDALNPESAKPSPVITNESDVSFADVVRAEQAIGGGILHHPCRRSYFLSRLLGMNIYLKLDLHQLTGSFKERGARNALISLTEEQKERGVIAASAGNHALALAWHGYSLGIPVTVIMPKGAPLAKVEKSRSFGANVVLHGDHIGDAKEDAETNPNYEGLTYINGYDDKPIIAGAGTVGLEMLREVPDLDAVIVPVGGGGLLAGIGLVAKELKPECLVIGVEPINCPSMSKALEANMPVRVDPKSTLADGLAVPQVGSRAFSIAKNCTDHIVTVSESQIALSILRLVEHEKLTCEGGAAASIAALLPEGPLSKPLQGKTVVVNLCGGNIDTTTLGRVLDRGLAADGRLVRFRMTVSDKPGGISNLAQVLKEAGASIKDIFHERAWLSSPIDTVQVVCVIEVTDREHGDNVRAALSASYPDADSEFIWGLR